jgi:hypothetical protein
MTTTWQRDKLGRFVKKDAVCSSANNSSDPPLVHLKITNPVTYIKLWWKKVMSGEGIDFRFRIHPVTAVLMVAVIAAIGFGVGRVTIPAYIPFVENKTPSPTTSPWKETALTGKLNITPNTGKYYLVTQSTEAVTLEIPTGVDLSKYIGKRILASGNYNKTTHVLKISDVLDLEVLPASPQIVVVPTPSSKPTVTPNLTIEPTVSSSENPSAIPDVSM